MSITIHPVSPALGAEIGGLDLARALRDDEFDAVREALLAYGAVFVRDQVLNPQDLIDFGRRLGPLNVLCGRSTATRQFWRS